MAATESSLSTRGLSLEAVEALAQLNGEPEWLVERRRAAWRAFEAMPMPNWSRGISKWWTMSLDALDFAKLLPFTAGSPDAQMPDVAGEYTAAEDVIDDAADFGRTDEDPATVSGGQLVQDNSTVISFALDAEYAAKGVIFTSLNEAVKKHPELVEKYFMTKAVTPTENKFTALHAALWNGGAFVYVPKGVVVDKPLQAVFYHSVPELALFTHTLIVTEADSKIIYVEEHRSPQSQAERILAGTNTENLPVSLDASVTEIIPGENSDIQYSDVNLYDAGIYNFSFKRSILSRNSRVVQVNATLGSTLTKMNIDSLYQGAGSNTKSFGLYFSSGDQHYDIVSNTLHEVAHTTGEVRFKGALDDHSQAGFLGLIRVGKKGQGTDSFLGAHTLQLSDEARGTSEPALEILANDVRCSHGASSGMLDEEQIIYLQSRGLPRPEAERLLVNGFFEEIIRLVPLEGVQRRLREELARKMANF